MSYSKLYFEETKMIIDCLDLDNIELLAHSLGQIKKEKGRLFILGVGGSAGNASHAVNDFRKICEIETYAPTDNVSEITARTNDEGWNTVFSEWLKVSNLSYKDALLIFSVGGGNLVTNISPNIVEAVHFAKETNCKIFGIVGRNGGYTLEKADVCVVVPPLFEERITAHTEGLCAVIWHLLVNHPDLKE